ncbi:MAG: hypothetical protein ACI4BC_11240 [Muribaculaceae bacterium]
MSEIIVYIIIVVLCIVLNALRKKNLPQNPNFDGQNGNNRGEAGTGSLPGYDYPPERQNSDSSPITVEDIENITWSDLIGMLQGEKNRRSRTQRRAPETPAAATRRQSHQPVTVPPMPETPSAVFLDSAREGASSLARNSSTQIIDDAYAPHHDATPVSAADWRKAIIASEILNRKY